MNELYQSYEFQAKSLQMGRLLGQGAFGQVHLAVTSGSKGDGRSMHVAVKSLRGRCHKFLIRGGPIDTCSGWYGFSLTQTFFSHLNSKQFFSKAKKHFLRQLDGSRQYLTSS